MLAFRHRIFLLLAVLALAARAETVIDHGGIVIDDEDDYEDPAIEIESVAFLVTRKHVASEVVVQERNMTVRITMHNIGKGAAKDVTVKDTLPDPKLFEYISGPTEGSFSTIEAGSEEQIEYTVVPKASAASVGLLPAKVSYTSAVKGTVSSRSSMPFLVVLSNLQNIERLLVIAGRYLSFGVLKTSQDWIGSGFLLAITVVLVGGYTLVNSVSRRRAESRRRTATRELEESGSARDAK